MMTLRLVAWLAFGAAATATADVIKHLDSGLVLQATGMAPYQGLQYAAEDRYSLQFTLVKDIREDAEEDAYILKSSNGLCVTTAAMEANAEIALKPVDRYCPSWKIDPASMASTPVCVSGADLCMSSDVPSEAMAPGISVVLEPCECSAGPRFSLPLVPLV